MHYLLLVYMDEKKWLQLPEAERQRVYRECEVYAAELTATGNVLGGAPLQLSTTARTIRADGDGFHVTDGPFAETKEVLAGYHLIECKDMAEAVAIGKRFPGLGVGLTVEARPLLKEK